MNERLDAFRKRLHATKPPKERPKIRDWLALTFSFVALSLSSLTTYYNVVVQREVLEGLIMSPIEITFRDKKFHPKGPLQVLFANRGTLPLAVVDATFHLTQTLVADDYECGNGAKQTEDREMVLDPFVIKPSELLIKTITVDETPVPLGDLKFEDYYLVRGCVRFGTVTTNGRGGESAYVGWWTFPTKGDSDEESSSYPIGSIERWPFKIVDRSGSIFFPLD